MASCSPRLSAPSSGHVVELVGHELEQPLGSRSAGIVRRSGHDDELTVRHQLAGALGQEPLPVGRGPGRQPGVIVGIGEVREDRALDRSRHLAQPVHRDGGPAEEERAGGEERAVTRLADHHRVHLGASREVRALGLGQHFEQRREVVLGKVGVHDLDRHTGIAPAQPVDRPAHRLHLGGAIGAAVVGDRDRNGGHLGQRERDLEGGVFDQRIAGSGGDVARPRRGALVAAPGRDALDRAGRDGDDDDVLVSSGHPATLRE